MQDTTTIKCPNCQTEIDVNEIIYHQLENQIKQDYLKEQQKFKEANKKRELQLKKELDELASQKERFDQELKKATKEQLRVEKQKLKESLKRELQEEQQESISLLQKELKAKSEQVKELNNATIEIARLKREKDELSSKAKAEAQLELNRLLQVEKEKIAKSLQEQNEQHQRQKDEQNQLKLKEKDEQIEQIKREFDNAQRKLEQGSMQIQGEALEVTIEDWLSSQFPFDSIEEVKKGAFGADCIQKIHTRQRQNCGVICYESKNAKTWSDGWITKLKQDMLNVNADIGVLVTTVYPKDMRRMSFVDGIWVCSLDEFKGSVSLLRESLIRLDASIKRDENRADKMSLLYSYLTGQEFSMQLQAIVDGFMQMQRELDKEKRSLMASWKRRQKTIDGVLANTTEMYGSLQGIAGSSAIVHIDALELAEKIEES